MTDFDRAAYEAEREADYKRVLWLAETQYQIRLERDSEQGQYWGVVSLGIHGGIGWLTRNHPDWRSAIDAARAKEGA